MRLVPRSLSVVTRAFRRPAAMRRAGRTGAGSTRVQQPSATAAQQPAAPPPVVVLPAAVASPSGGAVAVQQPALPPPVAVLSAALASPAGHAVPQAPQPAAPAAASASAQQAPATPPPPQPQTQPQQQKSRRSPQQQPRQQQADAQPIDHSPPAQQPGAFIADETEAALKVQILGAVQVRFFSNLHFWGVRMLFIRARLLRSTMMLQRCAAIR